MILINGDWETVEDLWDVSKIIRQKFNSDLADKLDKIIPTHTNEEYYELQCELEEKYGKISELEDKLSYKDQEVDEKNEKIEDLEKRIRELENQSMSTSKRYKVYEIMANNCYIGVSLVAANTAEEANKYIYEFKNKDENNDFNSFGYSKVSEDDVIENIWSEELGIIKYDIHYYG